MCSDKTRVLLNTVWFDSGRFGTLKNFVVSVLA